MSDELKPCPFCGCPDVFEAQDPRGSSVCCPDCCVRVEVSVWNIRANDKPDVVALAMKVHAETCPVYIALKNNSTKAGEIVRCTCGVL